jgi:hypothetical protein
MPLAVKRCRNGTQRQNAAADFARVKSLEAAILSPELRRRRESIQILQGPGGTGRIIQIPG